MTHPSTEEAATATHGELSVGLPRRPVELVAAGTRHVVAAVVLRDRLLALGAGFGRSFLSFLAHELVKFLVGLGVLDRPAVEP